MTRRRSTLASISQAAPTMDYHSVHGRDISSFDIPDTHRLPTIAASQALDDLKHEPALPLPTGLESLDRALGADSVDSSHCGGVQRAQVTEIWGPPGSGKTAMAIQTAAHAICHGHDVVWVDCFQGVDKKRIAHVVEAVKSATHGHISSPASAIDWSRWTHYSCLTLAHLMALISRPTTKSIAAGVSLVIVNCVSALLNSAFPKSQDGRAGPRPGKGLTASAKRVQGCQFVINALQKLAATRNCAVIVLSQCATRMQSEQGATLVAAVNAAVWEQGVATRLVLYRDWAVTEGQPRSVFMAGMQKLNGKTAGNTAMRIATFKVEARGMAEMEFDAPRTATSPAHATMRKRKLGQTELEIPDSDDEADDEDYGWADEDEAAMPAPPPQWQGSEDVLLGQEVGRSDEGTDEGADPDAA